MTDVLPAPQPAIEMNRPQRHAHVAQRLLERSGIVWPVDRVAALEQKIKTVRAMVNEMRRPAPILPTKIGEANEGKIHYYRVLIAGVPHTFVWSQTKRGLLTYRGAGELTEPTPTTP